MTAFIAVICGLKSDDVMVRAAALAEIVCIGYRAAALVLAGR